MQIPLRQDGQCAIVESSPAPLHRATGDNAGYSTIQGDKR